MRILFLAHNVTIVEMNHQIQLIYESLNQKLDSIDPYDQLVNVLSRKGHQDICATS